MSAGPRLAVAPFEIYTLAHVTRSSGQSANSANELLAALANCSDESIYHHTIAALRTRFASSERLLNDYAQWAYDQLGRSDLGDQMAMVDSQEFQTIGQLRNALCEALANFQSANPGAAREPAKRPFSLCEGMDVRVPVDQMARNLAELRKGIEGMSGESFYLHFVASRARADGQGNDFSLWLRNSLGLGKLAAKIDEIDVMEGTLEDAREKLLALIDVECGTRTGSPTRPE